MKKAKRYISLILIAVLALSCLAALAACDKKDDGHRLVEQETIYYINTKDSKVKNFPLGVALDKNNSMLILRPDGTAIFRLQTIKGLRAALELFNLDVEGTDLSIILNMLYEYLPGLDFTDLSKTLEVFEGGLKIKLLGIDPANEELQAMFTYIAETGTLPAQLIIPDGFGLEINTTYYIKDVKSGYSGITYTGIYMGNSHEDGEPFLMFDLTTDEKGQPLVIMDYEIINLYILASPRAAE